MLVAIVVVTNYQSKDSIWKRILGMVVKVCKECVSSKMGHDLVTH